jgi:hypothetical protein
VGWLTWSAGAIPALLAGGDPAFFIDAEAPSDRLSIRPPLIPGAHARRDLEAAHLRGLQAPEPYRLLAALRCPYQRLQAARDHQHGACALHARVMLDHAAPGSWINGAPWTGRLSLPAGALALSGADVLDHVDRFIRCAAAPGRRL